MTEVRVCPGMTVYHQSNHIVWIHYDTPIMSIVRDTSEDDIYMHDVIHDMDHILYGLREASKSMRMYPLFHALESYPWTLMQNQVIIDTYVCHTDLVHKDSIYGSFTFLRHIPGCDARNEIACLKYIWYPEHKEEDDEDDIILLNSNDPWSKAIYDMMEYMSRM